MSQLLFFEGLLKNLRQEIPPDRRRTFLTRDRAYELLKERTGEDFGYDADRWEQWLRSQGKPLSYDDLYEKEGKEGR